MKNSCLNKTLRRLMLCLLLLQFTVAFSQQSLNGSLNLLANNSGAQSGSQSYTASSENTTPFEYVKGKKEDVKKRDAFSKHYINADGSFTALIGAGPIHYQKNGKWEDISTKISNTGDSEFPFKNISNVMESHFGKSLMKGILSKTKEGVVHEFVESKMYWEVKGKPVNIQEAANTNAVINNDRITFPNVFGEVSAEFTIKTGQRKLNYIIPTKKALGFIPKNAEYLVFSERIILPNELKITDSYRNYNKIKKRYEDIPGIFILDKDNNVVYSYSANTIIENYNPDMMGIPSQISPEIFLEKIGDKITIYTKVKAEWLRDGKREFPIAIDPTSTVYPFTTTYTSGQCFPTGGADGNIYAGYNSGWTRGWLTFDLTSVPSLAEVTGATMYLYVGAKVGTMGSGSSNNIYIGHTSFDLSRLKWLTTYNGIYNAITANNNAMGAYSYFPAVSSTTAYTAVNLGSSAILISELERKSGSDQAFFPVSFSPSWGSGTTNRMYGIYGYSDGSRKPYLTITYNTVDKYKHAAYRYGNAAVIGDVGYVQIGNVNIGTINNTTAITNYAAAASVIYRNTPTGYNKYDATTNVNIGSTYPLNVTYRDLGSPYNSGKIGVWVDWNEDGDFADDNEFIGVSANTTSGNQVRTFDITVPSNVSSGKKRLRVRSFLSDDVVNFSNYDTTYDYGETEDYDIVVNPVLEVFEAYSGASYANGVYNINYNSAVNLTSGTRPGYNCIGWIGTGSIPANGTVDNLTVTIDRHSTITWLWEAEETTCLISTTWDGSSWSDGFPASMDKKIIFDGAYHSAMDTANTTGTLYGCSVEVRSGLVELADGHNLIIDHEIRVKPEASFIVHNRANLVQVLDEPAHENEGVITYLRDLTLSSERKEYNYFSSPVANQHMKMLIGNNATNTPYVLKLNESTNYFMNAAVVDYAVVGKGFAVKEPKLQYTDNGTLLPGHVARYVGKPNNGPYTLPLTYTGTGLNDATRGYNVVGNPYPSNLDLVKLYQNSSSGLSSTFEFWDNTVNATYEQMGLDYEGYSYAFFNPASGPNGTGNPAPGGDPLNEAYTGEGMKIPNRVLSTSQGFMVKANSSTAALRFSNNQRITASSPVFFGKSEEGKGETDRFWLQLVNTQDVAYTTAVVYFDGGQNAFSPDDTAQPMDVAEAFYTFAEETAVMINGRSSFSNADVVRLGIKIPVVGKYKIQVFKKEGIFADHQKIYLRDKLLNVVHPITQEAYEFGTDVGEFTDRFEILYKPNLFLGVDDAHGSTIQIYKEGKDFVIKSATTGLREVEVYDVSGKLLKKIKTKQNKIVVDAAHFSSGVYMMKVEDELGIVHSRKVRK